MSNKRAAPERVFLYCRQSKSDGDGERSISLASQERMLRDLAEERGLVVVGVEIDADVRGWREERDRPGLSRALNRAEAGEFDALAFYDISRVARDVFILERLVRELNRFGVRPISLKEPQIEDAFYRQILGAIAEKYTRDLSAHATRGLAERTRRGLAHGPAPYGFVKVGGKLVTDEARPERVRTVRDMFDLFVNHGKTHTEIAVEINGRGERNAAGAPFSVRMIGVALGNVAYAGDVQTGDITTRDAHEPIVGRELFERAQERLTGDKRHNRKRKDESSWLEGFVFHECGERAYFVIEPAKSPYFRCRCNSDRRRHFPTAPPPCTLKPKSKRAIDLESEVWSIITADVLSIVPAERAVENAWRNYQRQAPNAAKERRDVTRAMQRLDHKFARAEALYIDGARPRDWLNDRESEIARERTSLMARLEAFPPEPDERGIRDAAAVLAMLTNNVAAFAKMPDEFRRLWIARLGYVVYGPSGVFVVYAPEIAPLIPGAVNIDRVTSTEPILGAVLLTSLRFAFTANRGRLPGGTGTYREEQRSLWLECLEFSSAPVSERSLPTR